MSARRARGPLLLTVALAVLPLSGCYVTYAGGPDGATSRSQCVTGSCTVTLTGEQTVRLAIATADDDVAVGPIEPAAVTVAAHGGSARLAPGASADLGPIAVTLVSVSGPDVTLEVRSR